ncbi:hypoxanthine-DNA glycosylase [Brevundimonas alba]|uniref:Hypoxanthine-DNA glycosylase n=1 Tax=Brevundimonas alba TaxID=74314 RepID=A0A7X6BNN4_9CAUL|nr:hypoxanthine-DNA glycosylase [Brevundimonas alba]
MGGRPAGNGRTGAFHGPDADALNRKRAFDPVVDERTRLLILGSLPGDTSLRAGQYYGHPQNAFWRLIGGVIRRELAALPYEDRLAALTAARVGLWDVIASAERPGSLDAAIRLPEAADLRGLVEALPDLRVVAFNGGTAARLGRAVLRDVGESLTLIDLPSSSPAHARRFADKALAWSVLSPWIA